MTLGRAILHLPHLVDREERLPLLRLQEAVVGNRRFDRVVVPRALSDIQHLHGLAKHCAGVDPVHPAKRMLIGSQARRRQTLRIGANTDDTRLGARPFFPYAYLEHTLSICLQ